MLFAMQNAVAADTVRTEFFTEGGSLWLPPQSSTTAPVIDSAFYFILYSSTILTIGVAIAMVYLAWKYRRKSHADRPAPVKESKLLELSWSILPTIMVVIVFFWGFRSYVDTSIAPSDSYEIRVKGQKWFWTFEYPNGTVMQNEVVVPAGQPVKFVMSSQDVLHSFFVPAFRIKHDVIPNRYSYVWFEAPQEGMYQVVCTEYCGTDHSNMGAKIRVVGRDQFFAFLRDGPGGGDNLPLADLGEQLYTSRNCNTCHTLDGSAAAGPSWLGTWGETRTFADGSSAVMDDNYVRQSLVDPGSQVVEGFIPSMPAYDFLSDREIRALAAYMREINGVATEADTTLTPVEGDAAASDSLATEAPTETSE
ncbi:MAG: cytochrome c oxidase subunit II [Rubricoccaceae bacterium]|nr:cytochrome c oxidase subunit II [Rubricoccaceae bacterium]